MSHRRLFITDDNGSNVAEVRREALEKCTRFVVKPRSNTTRVVTQSDPNRLYRLN